MALKILNLELKQKLVYDLFKKEKYIKQYLEPFYDFRKTKTETQG